MPVGNGKGQWCIYYFASRCKAAWKAFEDHKDDWRNDPQKHQWWTIGLRLEGDRLAKAIGYHVAAGFIVKVPSWVSFFILRTHPQQSDLASLPQQGLLVDPAYMDDPSNIFAASHVDWWNNPGGPLTPPAAYSEEETAAFHDWLKLVDQPLTEDPPPPPQDINVAALNAPAARILDAFQSALLRIEQGLGTWRNIRDGARSDIQCLEHLMDEVQLGQLDLTLPPNLPIPKGPWRSIPPMRSRYIFRYTTFARDNTSSVGSDSSVVPPADMVTEPTCPTADVTEIGWPPGHPSDLSPLDNTRDDYFPSPVSSTGLDWEFSEEGSDHESSIDFGMSEYCEDVTCSNSGSE
ncbi:uncharacterized protein LACBIDRAFT_325901 [Laccaria bicolor S238N-H82]|uniref:Predicted protein n=1 Tax=Laccaria bicolor (strain S238N-H82 / ATCC MYA-4686) TaxID=486041 RepID=B0D6M1_LACBS|nr:uncharacterized protein LACBIDRAFT_325901 [Laccaria bicolor S238N-H82]EDR10210.1 predicted protein [Laccaria bicolor S238N-H82]|eukprot:XP_001879595.1 predicted protein [Laccaria bicolor S238N-H82]